MKKLTDKERVCLAIIFVIIVFIALIFAGLLTASFWDSVTNPVMNISGV